MTIECFQKPGQTCPVLALSMMNYQIVNIIPLELVTLVDASRIQNPRI